METYKPFSVVVVPFPFTDKKQAKRRPALVLSNVEHQQQTAHVTLAMITSAKNSTWPDDHLIHSLKSTGLSAPSIVRQKIFTLDYRLVINRIGELHDADKRAVMEHLKNHLHLF